MKGVGGLTTNHEARKLKDVIKSHDAYRKAVMILSAYPNFLSKKWFTFNQRFRRTSDPFNKQDTVMLALLLVPFVMNANAFSTFP